MEQGSILDTNIVIYYVDGALHSSGKVVVEEAISNGARISVISKIGLLSWNPPEGSDATRIHGFINDSIILALNDDVVDRTIRLRRTYRKIKLPDAIIAATALHFSLSLITRNERDFSFIGGLKVINPFQA